MQKIVIIPLRVRMLMRSKVSMHVETCVQLVKKMVNAKEHITVTLDSTEFETTRAECKATYQ